MTEPLDLDRIERNVRDSMSVLPEATTECFLALITELREARTTIVRLRESLEIEHQLYDKLYAVLNAIRNPGSNPTYHARQIEQLRREWPTLWDAIQAVILDLSPPVRSIVTDNQIISQRETS